MAHALPSLTRWVSWSALVVGLVLGGLACGEPTPDSLSPEHAATEQASLHEDRATLGIGPPARMVFKQQPSNRNATESFGVQVAFLDESGNPTYGSWTPVTLTINKGAFKGSYLAYTSYGVASFGPLSVSEPGTDYVFTAGSNGFASIQSEPFSIAERGLTYLTARFYQSPATIGVPALLEVRALDNFRNVYTAYTGTVIFTSDDPTAILPEPYTFTAADAGVKSFFVTFNSLGKYASWYAQASDRIRSGLAGVQIVPAPSASVGGPPPPLRALPGATGSAPP
jgi:hypothetical protein